MNIQSTGAILILLLFSTFRSYSQINLSLTLWQSGPVNIDGNNNEWQKPFHLYEPTTGLIFEISNDNTNLYLCFESNEKQKIHKLMRAGWEINLSSKDKKNKFNSTITFPAIQMEANQNNKSDYSANPEETNKEKFSIGDIINSYRLRLSNITTGGFTTQNGSQPLYSEKGIKIAIGTDSTESSIIYEIAIPLTELSSADLLGAKELQLDVTVNALDKPSLESTSNNHYSGQRNSGSGNFSGEKGMGEGKYGSYHQGNNSFDRSAMFEKATLKQSFTLVKN